MRLTFRVVSENDPGSWMIQRFSAGKGSHIGLMLDRGQYELGARSDLVGGKPRGVQIRPANYGKFASQTFIDLDVTPDQEWLVKSFMTDQLNKPYDWRAILGFATGRNWRDPNAWICSELVAAAVEYAGICGPLYLTASKITPVAAALILTAIGGQVNPCSNSPSPS